MTSQARRMHRKAMEFLSWEEWATIGFVLVAPHVFHWRSLLFVPLVTFLLIRGSSRRLGESWTGEKLT